MDGEPSFPVFVFTPVDILNLLFPEAVTETGHRLREMRGLYREYERHEWIKA